MTLLFVLAYNVLAQYELRPEYQLNSYQAVTLSWSITCFLAIPRFLYLLASLCKASF